jgi:hypothetical protein
MGLRFHHMSTSVKIARLWMVYQLLPPIYLHLSRSNQVELFVHYFFDLPRRAILPSFLYGLAVHVLILPLCINRMPVLVSPVQFLASS